MHYENIIIGSGQAGTPLALYLASKKQKTLIIEKEHWGGSCVNVGCTPSKTLYEEARQYHLAKRKFREGTFQGKLSLDFEKVMESVQKLVHDFQVETENSVHNTDHLEALKGEACFCGNKTITIRNEKGGHTEYTGDRIFINTGTHPKIPHVAGLESFPYYTNESIFSNLHSLPEHLVIIGGGFTGLEFAQMFKRLGSEVTVIHHGEAILESEDDDIAEKLLEILKHEGVNFIFGTSPKKIAGNSESFVLDLDDDTSISGTHLLLTAGRVPNAATLGLENTKIEIGPDGFIQVNDYLETNEKGVFALGEVRGSLQFTHATYNDFRILRDYFEGKKVHSVDKSHVPFTLFTDPQFARYGHNEKSISKTGADYICHKLEAASIDRAQEKGRPKGFIKTLVEKSSGQVLGASVLTDEGGEIMSMVQIAMMGGLTKDDLQNGIFTHPLYAETLNNLFGNEC